MRITAGQADELLTRAWFDGCTSEVEMYEGLVTVDEFDVEARAEEQGDTEMVLFGGGLTVRGTLDLSEEVHSIYAVRGPLRARRLILGDALLVVDGTVEIDEWIFGGETEGVFEVGGRQIESDTGHDAMLADLQAPVIVMFDRGRREFVLRENGEPREMEQLAARVLDDLDPDTRAELPISARLRELLLAGQPIFR
ncbi:hypothetical protein [Actinoplanes regularis]|uniref:hypothetical protein n=1 Tax=Actinoplanes regularis TaxID=52697 RepID=UPI0024A12973|nr:hypothetical protein [Actinoplanes regularis]GLW33788.1 hypothetical protein Areg01_67260 [Actinoplanes regularis]